MKGLDGIQGPVYVGTGCVFNRQALYGYGPPNLPILPKASSSCSWCGCCTCCCPPKKPAKDLSEAYRDAKREELDAAIFNLKEIESEYTIPIQLDLVKFFVVFNKLNSFNFLMQITMSMRGQC